MIQTIVLPEPVQTTPDTKEYFFGYFDKCPWNMSGRYLLAHEVMFSGRPPAADDKVVLGVVDMSRSQTFQPLTCTRAWNWQQGAMLQWWGGDPENTIVFNDRRDGRFVSVLYNIQTGKEKVLPLPVAAVSHDGTKAMSINFSRLADDRPGYGYEGIADPYRNVMEPENDGIFLMDMITGRYELIISMAQIAQINRVPSMEGSKHRFNHLLFSPNDKRFVFFHRWIPQNADWHITRMYTANIDGTDIYSLNDQDMTSHYDWYDDTKVIAFAHRNGTGDKYFMFTDKSRDVSVVGSEKLNAYYDGHCSISPDKEWMLTDSYPDKDGIGHLFLYNLTHDRLFKLGDFHSPFWNITMGDGCMRCDYHPRWSRDGRMICFDSTHSGSRQVYIMDISGILESV